MTKIGKLGPEVRAELQKRALEKDADIHRLVEDFVEDPGGSRILHSEGDGEVALLIPVRDGYQGPTKVQVTPAGEPTRILDTIPRGRTVNVEGVGRFYEFMLSPLRYKKSVDGERPALGLRGEGPDGFWSPMGFDGWFGEDLPLLADLATKGGLEVRPDVEIDPADPSWRKLAPDERAFVEAMLGRAVPEVVHASVIESALRKAEHDDGAIGGAVRSLRLSLEQQVVDVPAPLELDTQLAQARPILEKLYGAALFDGPLPRPLLELVEESLDSQGSRAEAALVRTAIRKQAVDPAQLDAAVDRVLGAGFSQNRQPTLQFLDQVIDRQGARLSLDEVTTLRTLRADLDYAAELDLFGEDLAERPLSTATADAKLKQLHQHLRGRSGVDEGAVFTLAAHLQAALNVPRAKPTIIIISGEAGPGVEQVMSRAQKLCSPRPIVLQAAADLRLDDPVGFLVGSPANEPGSARGVLVRESKHGDRFTATISGLERLGAQVVDPEARALTQKNFWSFVAQMGRDGAFRGYDPDDPNRAKGGKVDLAGGVILLQTSENVAELQAQMPPEVWAQLAPKVVHVGPSNASAVISQVSEQLADHISNAYGLKTAQVELAESAQALIRDLMAAGAKPAVLQRLVVDQLVDRAYFAAVDQTLAPKLRVELARGITAKERAQLVADWAQGKVRSLAGIGACPFVLFDAGKFQPEAATKFSAKVEKRSAENKELARLRTLVAEYQVGADRDDKKLRALLAENERYEKSLGAAENRIDELGWLNARATAEIKDLTRLNQLAKETIHRLEGDLTEANGRIDRLNADLKAAKGAAQELRDALSVAQKERDEIYAALRTTEQDFADAIRGLGAEGGRDPLGTLEMIAGAAQGAGGNRFGRALLEQMYLVAAARALEKSMGYARDFGKFDDITRLTRAYIGASHALGRNPDPQVLEGFERAARLTGNGWSRDLGGDWQRAVGAAAAMPNQDQDLMNYLLANILRQLRIRV